MLSCTIGVMAYNEEESIIPVLKALLAQRLETCTIAQIIVVASGCTDRTAERARAVAAGQPHVLVDEEPVRAGKAAAINRLISLAQGNVIVLCGADTLPDPLAIEALLRPFADPAVGMTGARVVPLNEPGTLMGDIVRLLWHVHHRLALHHPKLGELVAFRNIIPAMPPDTATDEVTLEAMLIEGGYRLAYVPDSIVYNRGPETLGDFLVQRRRIFAGHLKIAAQQGYVASSMAPAALALLGLDLLAHDMALLPLLATAAAVEGWGRLLGTIDTLRGHSHRVWRQVTSTKRVQAPGRALRLAALTTGGALASRTVRRAVGLPASLGGLIWWDAAAGELLFRLPDHSADPQAQARAVAAAIGLEGAAVRLIDFPAWRVSEDPPLAARSVCASAF